MKLIIDIDEKIYSDLQNRGLTGMLTAKECECMNEAIYNGTPLPKGHGRLIDADAYLAKEKPRGINEDTWKESHTYKSITETPTIIEADKENK